MISKYEVFFNPRQTERVRDRRANEREKETESTNKHVINVKMFIILSH